ncbi:MAG: hypothetical protein WKF77_23035 [Planctomycetaceae bacterium]
MSPNLEMPSFHLVQYFYPHYTPFNFHVSVTVPNPRSFAISIRMVALALWDAPAFQLHPAPIQSVVNTIWTASPVENFVAEFGITCISGFQNQKNSGQPTKGQGSPSKF